MAKAPKIPALSAPLPKQYDQGDILIGADEKAISDIDVLIRSRFTLIAVNTTEENRARRLMEIIAGLEKHKDKGLFWWSRTLGMHRVIGRDETAVHPDGDAVIEHKGQPITMPDMALTYIQGQSQGLFVLADFAPYLMQGGVEDPQLVRQLRELAWTAKARSTTVFILGPSFPQIATLEPEVTIIDLPLPDRDELRRMLDQTVLEFAEAAREQKAPISVDEAPEVRDRAVAAILGLPQGKAEDALAKATIIHRGLTEESIPTLLAEKRQLINQTQALTYVEPRPESVIGGYAQIKKLLHEAAVTFREDAHAAGVERAGGLLLLGPPGTGKDWVATTAGSIMLVPTFKLDMGSVIGEGGGIVGQAEMTMGRTQQIIDTVGDSILIISEFEKVFGGVEGSGRSDGGTTARVIGSFLEWMAEQSGCMVIATANDVRNLQPEQIRSGRFDAVVFMDFPNEAERAEIFRVHLGKRLTPRGRTFDHLDIPLFARASNQYSGAEIEQAVKGGILDAFMDGAREIEDKDVLARIKSISPISTSRREEIDELREWAVKHLGAEMSGKADLRVGRDDERGQTGRAVQW